MKKIMIILGAVAMTACAQAASVDWTVTYAGKGSTWVNNDVKILAFDGADYDAVVKLVTVTGSDTLSTDLSNYSLNGSGTQFTSNFKGSAKSVTVSTTDAPSSMFWMILADGSTEAGSSIVWTAATDVSGNIYEPPATGSALSLAATSFANSGTIAQFSSGEGEGGGTGAIPEPTSGLLLVLGAAALALKRKCA